MTSNNYLKSYCNSWALVTGASSGIGAEFCLQLARENINLILVARRTDKLENLAKILELKFSIKTLVITQDLSLKTASETLRAFIESHHIKVRILVNNAAVGPWGHFERLPVNKCEDLLQLTFVTPACLIRSFLPHLQSFSSAIVINVATQAALQPTPYMSLYSAAKSGLMSLSLSLYEEFRKRDIYFQTLIPGPTYSEFDEIAEAYPCQLSAKRDSPEVVVRLSLKCLHKKKPVVSSAKNIFLQRIFYGLFPYRFILKEIGKMFMPSPHKSK
jgi:hypothetical protein